MEEERILIISRFFKGLGGVSFPQCLGVFRLSNLLKVKCSLDTAGGNQMLVSNTGAKITHLIQNLLYSVL